MRQTVEEISGESNDSGALSCIDEGRLVCRVVRRKGNHVSTSSTALDCQTIAADASAPQSPEHEHIIIMIIWTVNKSAARYDILRSAPRPRTDCAVARHTGLESG